MQDPDLRVRRGGWTRVPDRGRRCRAHRRSAARRCGARPRSATVTDIFPTRRSRRSCLRRLCIFPAPGRRCSGTLCGRGARARARTAGQSLRRASPPTCSPRRAICATSPSPGPPPPVIPVVLAACVRAWMRPGCRVTRGLLMCPHPGHRDRFAVSRGAPGPGAYTPVGFSNPANHPTPPRKLNHACASWNLLPAALGMRRGTE